MSRQPVRLTTLNELAVVRASLVEATRAAEATERAREEENERLAAEQRERNLFAITVGAVAPIKRGASPAPARQRTPAVARQRQRDEAAVLVESLGDGFDVETLLDTDDTLSFHRTGVGVDVVRKLRRGVWVLQGELDLHGLRRDEARERVREFLHSASRRGLRCVRIVHGKGLGSPGREPVLKDKVRRWLVQTSDVLAFVQARASEGGSGALVVLLRSSREPSPPRRGHASR